MFIKDLLQRETPSFSFEFFPPQTDEAFDALVDTIRDLQKLHPTFVSVTHGPGEPEAQGGRGSRLHHYPAVFRQPLLLGFC